MKDVEIITKSGEVLARAVLITDSKSSFLRIGKEVKDFYYLDIEDPDALGLTVREYVPPEPMVFEGFVTSNEYYCFVQSENYDNKKRYRVTVEEIE